MASSPGVGSTTNGIAAFLIKKSCPNYSISFIVILLTLLLKSKSTLLQDSLFKLYIIAGKKEISL